MPKIVHMSRHSQTVLVYGVLLYDVHELQSNKLSTIN